MRHQVSTRGAPAFAVFLGNLVNTQSLLMLGVEILGERIAGLACSFQIVQMEWIVGAQIADP